MLPPAIELVFFYHTQFMFKKNLSYLLKFPVKNEALKLYLHNKPIERECRENRTAHLERHDCGTN